MSSFFRGMRPPGPPAPEVMSDPSSPCLDIWQRGAPGLSGVDDELLCARIAEAVVWCDALGSSEDLRSGALRPSLFHDGIDDLVRDLGRNRQRELHARKLPVRPALQVVAPGKFMLYFPDENLADGFAEAISGGFFDVDNVPAEDTWVSFFSEDGYPGQPTRRYLLCYVPELLIDAADAGIDGNPESCIIWLEQSDVSIRRRVEALTHAS